MKLHLASTPFNTVTAYGDGFVEVNGERHAQSMLLFPDAPVAAWPPRSFDALAAEHFDPILAYGPEVLLLGTGTRQRFPHPRLTSALLARRVGVETMATSAACRTYNILMAEGRKVAAALILE